MLKRDFLKGLASGLLFLSTPAAHAATRALPASHNKNVVWIMLRGAMDSLHVVVPKFDKHLQNHRAALIKPIIDTLNPLDRGFGLHPSLETLYGWYQEKSLLPVVAVASPSRSRSHFFSQDLLESGNDQVDYQSGWLARALAQKQMQGLAFAHALPISMRGNQTVKAWYPSSLPSVDEDIYSQLMHLYDQHPQLQAQLQRGLEINQTMGEKNNLKRAPFNQLCRICGETLATTDTQAAMLEFGGWDTHNNQIPRLNRQLQQLDKGLQQLKVSLATQWQNTLVIIATEFGRTVKVNGTQGTDHGTASALFLAGGAVKGGSVMGEWPGLADHQLYKQRDLMPTSDIRSWIGAALQQHWSLNDAQMANVFPAVSVQKRSLIG
ncbi:DUF1501 domain-containing protein [Gayadomonas joobiniege]|uniref:DUF1501 domain-containing protein n=1 Tax=Gayadomonas joobiniege TaxID=1234606 RepID=UPI000375BF8A|nr:DUF1501 domain-containing protein [Gayadomonas joobiniege]